MIKAVSSWKSHYRVVLDPHWCPHRKEKCSLKSSLLSFSSKKKRQWVFASQTDGIHLLCRSLSLWSVYQVTPTKSRGCSPREHPLVYLLFSYHVIALRPCSGTILLLFSSKPLPHAFPLYFEPHEWCVASFALPLCLFFLCFFWDIATFYYTVCFIFPVSYPFQYCKAKGSTRLLTVSSNMAVTTPVFSHIYFSAGCRC